MYTEYILHFAITVYILHVQYYMRSIHITIQNYCTFNTEHVIFILYICNKDILKTDCNI